MEDTPAPLDTHIFIRFSTDAKYTEHVAAVDAEQGLPSGGTLTSHPPVSEAPRNTQGKSLIAIKWRDMAEQHYRVENGVEIVETTDEETQEVTSKEVMTYKSVLRPNVARALHKRASSKLLTGPKLASRKEWTVEEGA